MLGRYRHAYLLAALALLIVGRPFLPDLGRGLLTAMLALTLLTAAAASATTRLQVYFGIGLTGVILFAPMIHYRPFGIEVAMLSPMIGVIYWTFTASLIFRGIFLHTERVTADTINGAICIYLLMGLGWAQAYSLLAYFEPGSFSMDGQIIAAGADGFENFLPFSFVTLTTLGYGNDVPLTPKAEALAIAEAVAGQLYLAVLLARLVATEIANRTKNES